MSNFYFKGLFCCMETARPSWAGSEGGGRGRGSGSWASPNGSATKARRSPPHPLTQMARAITTPQVHPAQPGPGPGPL